MALPGEKVALSVLLLVAARGGSTVGSASISDFDPFTLVAELLFFKQQFQGGV